MKKAIIWGKRSTKMERERRGSSEGGRMKRKAQTAGGKKSQQNRKRSDE